MAKNCIVNIELIGDDSAVEQITKDFDENNFAGLLPVPNNLTGEEIPKWCLKNWGVKRPMDILEADGCYIYGITANQPPLEWVEYLCKVKNIQAIIRYEIDGFGQYQISEQGNVKSNKYYTYEELVGIDEKYLEEIELCDLDDLAETLVNLYGLVDVETPKKYEHLSYLRQIQNIIKDRNENIKN